LRPLSTSPNFIMESGEIFTPASEIIGTRPKPVEKAPPAPKPKSGIAADPDKAKRLAQVHFKASHGLIVAFFTFILYVWHTPLSAVARRG
jgi:phosphatidylinositol glycan class O